MNRPRHSVLALFDPLAADASPGDHDDDNKENATPVPTSRSYRSRLVDIGDSSIDDQDLPIALVSSWPPRTPLAELTLRDPDPTPLAKTKPHPDNDLHDSSLPPITERLCSPEIVISSCHSVNTRDMVSPSPSPELPHAESSSHSDTSSSLLHTPSISSCPNRLSMDLQASFQMHFKCDATFDLLNDNISLTEPMESLMTDDDTFDFELEKENLQDAIGKFRKGPRTVVSQGGSTKCDSLSQENSDTPPSSPGDEHLSLRHPLISPPCSPVDDQLSKRQSIPSKLPSPTAYSSPKPSFSALRQEVTPFPEKGSARPKQRRLSAPLATPQRQPSIALPPVVHALRIVKRARAPHPKPESAGNADLRAPTNTTSYDPPVSTRRTTEGNVHFTKAELSIPVKSSIAPSTSSIRTGLGPRRVPCSDAPVGNTTTKPNQTTLPAALGPRRIPINNARSNVPSSKSLSIATGLKQPTRFEPIVSNLPRPSGLKAATSMSRLPAPTLGQFGLSRLRRPTGGLSRRVTSGE